MDEFSVFSLLLMGMVVLMSMFMISAAIRIVPEYKRAVVFRLGRYLGVYGPGLMLVLPAVDRAIFVDLREQTRSLSAQRAITADNVPLTVDLSWSYRVTDPAKSVLEAANPDKTLENVARQAWRDLVEAQTLDAIIHHRPHLRNTIYQQLEAVTVRWGIEMTGVQLSEIKKGN